MARAAPTDSATSQFFLCIGDQPELDFGGRRNPDGQGFAAFGHITTGASVVSAIQKSPADGQNLTPPILIQSAVIEGANATDTFTDPADSLSFDDSDGGVSADASSGD